MTPTTTLTLIVHDGNGTWFSPSGLWVSALTQSELEALEEGDAFPQVPAVPLLEVLDPELGGDLG